jgi:glycerophosphoryl diester phosphodiesterase
MSPIVYAHRGASFELPENTLESFALALELGADAIETDAHMTRDGWIVLAHDPTGERTAGVSRAIKDVTLAEVRTWNLGARFVARRPGIFDAARAFRIPTLDEALARFPRTVFNVDAKQTSPDMIPALLRAIRAADAEKRVRVASFSRRNLVRARAFGYGGETGLASTELARLMLAPRPLLRFVHAPGDAAQVPRRVYGISFDRPSAIDRLHALGLRVDFWTIDDPVEARRLFALGADGVMTDDPRLVCQRVRT